MFILLRIMYKRHEIYSIGELCSPHGGIITFFPTSLNYHYGNPVLYFITDAVQTPHILGNGGQHVTNGNHIHFTTKFPVQGGFGNWIDLIGRK